MIDFDDLDEAAADRLEEDAEDEAALTGLGAVEPPAPWSGGFLPAMRSADPKSTKLPSIRDMPAYFEAGGIDRSLLQGFSDRGSALTCRLLIFYGAGDGVPAWTNFMGGAPEWLDMAVFESPGHGFRKGETIPESLEEVAKEAFQAAKEVLQEHAKGGSLEGAPFALAGHSMGCQLMCEVARLARQRLGLEPLCLFPIDRGAPHLCVYTEEGHRLLCLDEPQEFFDGFNPMIGKLMQDPARHKPGTDHERQIRMWQRDLRNCQEHLWELGLHIFRCDIHMLCAEENFQLDEVAKAGKLQSLPPEVRRMYEICCRITESGPKSGAPWSRESFTEWEKWTARTCKLHWVQAGHVSIKGHPDTLKVVVQGISDALAQQ